MPGQSRQTPSQETPTPEGRGTVVGSAADTEYAFDNSFTPALVAALSSQPNVSLDTILSDMTTSSLGSGDNDNGLHHPTIVEYGERQPAPQGQSASKTAVLIANQNYVNISSLNTPIAETSAFGGALQSRGFTTSQSNDQDGASMTSLWNGLVSDAEQGDELVAYYAGHGAPDGLCGINDDIPPNPTDLVSYGTVNSIVSTATSKGANIRFVMDSCHSGTGVQLTREERVAQVASSGDGVLSAVASLALQGLIDSKHKLVEHCEEREQVLNQMDSAISQHGNQLPADDAPDAAWIAWEAIDDGLRAAKTQITAEYDAKADELWSSMKLVLNGLALVTWSDWPPSDIADYRTLGAQLNYLDDLSNSIIAHFDSGSGD